MKQCPKCPNLHNKPGIFCSRTCSNSRIFSEESKKKKSLKSIEAFKRMTEEDLKIRSENITKTARETKGLKLRENNFDILSLNLKRERLLLEQNGRCDLCQTEQIWNNKPLKFQLDHINGDRRNETRINLRMICPNCHTQTETYGGKNGRKITNQQIADVIHIGNNNQICLYLGLNPSAYSYKRIEKIRLNIAPIV
jgi:hypothetical protein